MHDWSWIESEHLAAAWVIVREMHGITREQLTDGELELGVGFVPPRIELIEDYGAWPDEQEMLDLAWIYEVTPGELIDAVYTIAEAGTHDVQGELEGERQADLLMRLLRERGQVTKDDMVALGIATGNVPENILFDRGEPVEWVHEDPDVYPIGVPSGSATLSYRRIIGIRLKSDEQAD